jgi:hypothetical protein
VRLIRGGCTQDYIYHEGKIVTGGKGTFLMACLCTFFFFFPGCKHRRLSAGRNLQDLADVSTFTVGLDFYRLREYEREAGKQQGLGKAFSLTQREFHGPKDTGLYT